MTLQTLLPSILAGTGTTVLLFLGILVISLPLGILVAALRLSKYKVVSGLTAGYIYCMRGIPLLLLLMFFYFGFPAVGITLERYTAVFVSFILNYVAYFAEIFRGGIMSVEKGQREASQVLGFSKTYTFFQIVLPQAMKKSLPALSNEIISLIKSTSLISVLGIGELLRAGRIAVNTYASLVPFLLVAVVYLILVGVLTKLCSLLEKRYAYYR